MMPAHWMCNDGNTQRGRSALPCWKIERHISFIFQHKHVDGGWRLGYVWKRYTTPIYIGVQKFFTI
jgi:hypothetical protein